MKLIFLILLLTVSYLQLCSGSPKPNKNKSAAPAQPENTRGVNDKPNAEDLKKSRDDAMVRFGMWLNQRGGMILDNRVTISQYIGREVKSGSFGFIIRGYTEINIKIETVAVKFQWKPAIVINMYETEKNIMIKNLECTSGNSVDRVRRGVPHVYFYGSFSCPEYDSRADATVLNPTVPIPTSYPFNITDLEFEVIAMTFLPHRLTDVQFTRPVDMICMVAITTIRALMYLHSKLIIHRDIKPDNILFIGRFPVIVDYGMACHRDYCEPKRCGSQVYNAPNGKYGHRQSEADDVYALFLSIIDKFHGLPWRHESDPNKILKQKVESMGKLCAAVDARFNLGNTFTNAWTHLQPCVQAGTRPNYRYLAEQFNLRLHGNNIVDTFHPLFFDWTTADEVQEWRNVQPMMFTEIVLPPVNPIPQGPKATSQYQPPKPQSEKRSFFCGLCRR